MAVKVKGIYGGVFAKAGGFKLEDNPDILDELGKLAVLYIEQEATKVAGRYRGLPKSAKFLKSFSYRIVGKQTIQIESSWPYVKFESYIKGRRGWRVGKPGKVIPMRDKSSGQLIFRTVPTELKVGNCTMWCHPGLARHTFVKKGIARARKDVIAKYGTTMVGNHLRGKQQ